jgi:hypothetical protein
MKRWYVLQTWCEVWIYPPSKNLVAESDNTYMCHKNCDLEEGISLHSRVNRTIGSGPEEGLTIPYFQRLLYPAHCATDLAW